MTLTHIANLLPPLTNAISLQSWEDAEDIAREITRLCRLKRLQELQAIQEASALKKEAKIAPGGSQVANSPPVGLNSEVVYHRQVTAGEMLEALASPVKAKAAKEAGWNTEELKQAAEIAYRPEPGITLEARFDEISHHDAWRNEVARELNYILGRAEYHLETSNDESDQELAKVVLSIVARVAQFEEIRVKP